MGDVGGRHAPSIFKIARKLIKSQPCCKRNGHTIFCDFVLFSNSSLWKHQKPPPQLKVFRQISACIEEEPK